LIIISIFLILSYHLDVFTKAVESSMEISVMVDYDHESKADEDAIKAEIEKIPGVKEITYSSKEDELEYYISSFEDERTREVFEPFKEDNPMHDAFYVEAEDGDDISLIAADIEKIEGVDAVNYGGQSTINMVSAMSTIRRIGTILVVALSLLAIFLIANTIKLTIYARKDEIDIMKNVGATNGFIRSPFLWEGMITGFMGAIIPVALTVYGYYLLYKKTDGILVSNMFKLVEPFPFLYYLSAVLAGIGILVGLFGSWISVTKYLRVKR